MTTPAVFEKYPDAESLSKAGIDELFPYIKSISYPNNKTKHLIGDIALGVGVVSLGAAIVLFATRSSEPSTTVSIAPVRGGGAGSVMTRF